MNISAIRKFNSHKGDIHVPAGSNTLASGRILEYPEYTGSKDAWYEFYDTYAKIKQWHASWLNDTLHHLIGTVQYH